MINDKTKVNENRTDHKYELVDEDFFSYILFTQFSKQNVLILIHTEQVVVKKHLNFFPIYEELLQDKDYDSEGQSKILNHVSKAIVEPVKLIKEEELLLFPILVFLKNIALIECLLR